MLHDLRNGAPTLGATLALDMTGDQDRGLYIPPGVAHGFSALSDVLLWYLVDQLYDPEDELGVAWDDPALGVDWGVAAPVVSERDRRNPRLDEVPAHLVPSFLASHPSWSSRSQAG